VRTLLLNDLVDSTKMVDALGDERAAKIFEQHDRMARELLKATGGREIDKSDGFLMLFERPMDAVRFALGYHAALEEISERERVTVSSRVGIHVGEVVLRVNSADDVARGAKPLEVEGLAKAMAARFMTLAGLAAFSRVLETSETLEEYLTAITVIPAVTFMAINALRISWIVHLSFREKMAIIGLSTLMIGLLSFIVFTAVLNGTDNLLPFVSYYLEAYSPPLSQFMLMVAVFGYLTGRPDFLDISLLYALINFIGTVAVLKFFEYRDLGRASRGDGDA